MRELARHLRWILGVATLVMALGMVATACGSPTAPRFPDPHEDPDPGDQDDA